VNTWKVIFATVVIFGAGVVTGGLLVKYSVQTPPRPHGQANRAVQPISAGGIRIEFLRRAERDLNLTAEQREQVDKILAASQERSKKIMEPVQPKIREELQETREQFRAVLNPEQKMRFDELLKQQQQQRQREQHRPPPRNPEAFSYPTSNTDSSRKP
jgi:P pilus assembly/Cpx signaling pathway, periplasmic inhibitor/zinc-resistance associated protein